MQIATFIGGVQDGKKIAVDSACDFVDLPDQSDPAVTGLTIRYRKKLWSRVLDETTGQIKTDAFFVLDSLSEQDATTLLIKHIKEHGPT